jgi:hypothetical protein
MAERLGAVALHLIRRTEGEMWKSDPLIRMITDVSVLGYAALM